MYYSMCAHTCICIEFIPTKKLKKQIFILVLWCKQRRIQQQQLQ